LILKRLAYKGQIKQGNYHNEMNNKTLILRKNKQKNQPRERWFLLSFPFFGLKYGIKKGLTI